MTRSEKLNSALELLEFKLNKELSSLADMMQKKIENEKKLRDLINYKDSYSLNNKSQTISSMQLNHTLMNKVQKAIEVQHGVVERMENMVNEKIQLLKKDRAQTKALELLIGRYRKQEVHVKSRNDQRELDNQILVNLKQE